MTLFHAEVVSELLDSAGLRAEDVDVIGFHGHTVYHNPAEKISIQIGDGDCWRNRPESPSSTVSAIPTLPTAVRAAR